MKFSPWFQCIRKWKLRFFSTKTANSLFVLWNIFSIKLEDNVTGYNTTKTHKLIIILEEIYELHPFFFLFEWISIECANNGTTNKSWMCKWVGERCVRVTNIEMIRLTDANEKVIKFFFIIAN